MGTFGNTFSKYWGKFKQGVKDDPVKAAALGVSSAALGVGTLNYMTGVSRQKQSARQSKQQIAATERLTNALGNLDTSIKKQISNQAAIPTDEQLIAEEQKNSTFHKIRKKLFSIEEGSYQGGKRSLFKANYGARVAAGAAIGAAGGAAIGHNVGAGTMKGTLIGMGIGGVIGAGVGAFTGWIQEVADRSVFNTGRAEDGNSYELLQYLDQSVTNHESRGEDETVVSATQPTEDGGSVTVQKRYQTDTRVRKPQSILYEVDADPRKCVVSLCFRFGVLVMYVHNPSRQELGILNKLLDKYCYTYKNADYVSTQVNSNCYVIELSIVGYNQAKYMDILNYFILPLTNGGEKVNIISGTKMGVKFRDKSFSLKSDMIVGAGIGATLGGVASIPFKDGNSKTNHDWGNALMFIGGGTLLGAALGAIVHGIKDIATTNNRMNTVDARLMQTVVEDLKRSGFKEGVNFTRDPKTANELKTRVCIVIAKHSGEMRLLINTVADAKLKDVSEGMVKRLPNTSAVTKEMSDKFNDITVTTVSDNSANAGLISGICDYYIHHGYPVYLVEVG